MHKFLLYHRSLASKVTINRFRTYINKILDRIESLSSSFSRPAETSLISSASSAVSRISSAVNAESSSARSSALSSASSAQQSASRAVSSISASASPTQNAGAVILSKDFPNGFGIQFLALATLFVASFVILLA